jgi:hypothetical protein
MSESPFSDETLTQVWSSVPILEVAATLPPLDYTDAQTWINFLIQASGTQCVFTLPATFSSTVPISETPSGYFRMKSNTIKWTISPGPLYNFSFEMRAAL